MVTLTFDLMTYYVIGYGGGGATHGFSQKILFFLFGLFPTLPQHYHLGGGETLFFLGD
jgi:hypothetical protein